jgi:peptidoglycan/xylan/chitin deacetylase (PgdA/CDA1 family)
MKQSILLTSILVSFLTGCIGGFDIQNQDEPVTAKNTEFMLSFDDGPLPDKSERVLDILATISAIDGTPVKAGFFLLADAPEEYWLRRFYYAPYELWTQKGSMAKYPEITRRIQQAGHSIGNHTTHHSWLRWPWLDTHEAVLSEFTQWEAISTIVLGTSNGRLFRPPYFIVSQNVRDTAKQLGYQIVMGESVDDAIPGMTVKMIKLKTQSILTAWDKPFPCLLIFHDTRSTTYLGLSEIVSNLQRQGFRLIHFDPKRL